MKNPDQFEEYLEKVLSKIQFKAAHLEIRRELLGHLQDAYENLKGLKLPEEEVMSRIYSSMGDPYELGRKLSQVHQPKTDWTLIALVGALFSISSWTWIETGYFAKQFLWFLIGTIPLLGFATINPKAVQKASAGIYIATVLCGILLYFFGVRIEDQLYFVLGPLTIKFVDFSTIPLVFALAGFFSRNSKKSLVLTVIPLIVYLAMGSIYPAVLFFASTLIMLLASNSPSLVIFGYAGIGTGLFSLLARWNSLLHASSNSYTDFIFSTIRSRSPLLGTGTAVVSVLLVVYLILASRSIKNTYGKTATSGAAALLTAGILSGLASNLGLIPMPSSGIQFPFLSYGASFLVGNMALIGFVVGLRRRKNLQIY